jgi:hypothetical protein
MKNASGRILLGAAISAAIISVSSLPGFAQDFHMEWVAQMEADEGGDVFTASVFSVPVAGSDYPPEIRMTCFDTVNVRYLFPESGMEPAESDFTFTNESDSVTLSLHYEDMDGAFAGNIAPGDALIELLSRGDQVTVTEVTGTFPPHSFSLKGSPAALGALLDRCN